MIWTINMNFFPCDVKGNAVNCSDTQLDHVPLFHSKNVTLLNLSNTKIRRLQLLSFQGVPNLRTLNVNCIPSCQVLKPYTLEIDNDTFTTLKKLEKLSLYGNSLTSLPRLPKSLKHLDVRSNNIFHINSLKAPNLEILLFSKNCYYANGCKQSFHISEDVFKHLPKLKNLTLGYNNLITVPKGLPATLEHLDLKENTITEIPNYTFENFTRLVYLSLEWNCQRCDHAVRPCFPCPNDASLQLNSKSLFSQNSSIAYLSLRGNSLRTFPKGLFTPLTKLRRLDLSDNFLSAEIQNGTFFAELKKLTWISLIYNYEPKLTYPELNLSSHLAEISGLHTLKLTGYFFVKLSDDSYKVLSKLHNLTTLDLSLNFLHSCDMTALSTLPSIRTIDVSQNMLKGVSLCREPHAYPHAEPLFVQMEGEVPTVEYSPQRDLPNTMPDKETEFLTIANFRKKICNNTLTFNVSANDILFLDQDVFKGMENAVCVDLSFNYMNQALKNGFFTNMTKLAFLDLSYNRFDLYYRGAFSELKNTLKVLDLSNNDFHFNLKGMGHDFEFINDLTELSALSLTNNHIGMRISKTLISSSLNYLYFNGNHLGIMWETDNYNYNNFFQNLTNLTHLDISDNHLTQILPNIWCNFPTSIRFLKISRNQLSSFPWQNLSTLLHLEYLDLSHNRIHVLPPTIEFGANLSTLDLSSNWIASTPDLFFSNIKSLRSLYLHSNQIKEFKHETFSVHLKNDSTLGKLTLHWNPFRCDCHTAWFADFLSKTTIEIPHLTTLVQCGFPESQQGRSILRLAGQSSCQDQYGELAILLSTLLCLMLTALPLLNHLYSWDLWYSLQVLWAGYRGYSQIAGSDSKHHYDAFVLFDTKNDAVRDWVYNEMIWHLENTEHRRFSLCLEERDWIPGLSCIENLHNAVYKSVKTVFVLSGGADTANGVIRQAFFMVQQRLLDEKVDSAVLVLLDDLFPKLKYLQLRRRLCKRSVLSWPKNPKAQPLFWNDMRMALSLDNLKFYDQKMSEGFV
ncbi:toll-like receptor 9 [Eucyclogobius newberryi]|uniref:toll-like receptor 9 n=1 Tax=Eucyclogobius newberryi TaxID=166745 RepID=UPI003B5B11DD